MNITTYFKKSVLNNQRGNTTMTTLFVVGIISTGVYFLANKVITERKLTAALRKNIGANLALRSTTDYVKYGIRKGWCFDENLLPDTPENCVGSFTHPRSTFRLLMPDSYEKSIRDLKASNPTAVPDLPPGDLSLATFTFKTPISNVSPQHPLFRILQSIKTSIVKYVQITAERVEDQTLPINGDEVYARIKVEFLDTSSNVIQDGAEFFRETSMFVTNPREVNSFALIVANNLYLGTAAPTTNAGNAYIPAGDTTYRGLFFNSPIYVNGNININKNVFTPVTFKDTVTLGNGAIRDGVGDPFTTGKPLGSQRYWTDLTAPNSTQKVFGGFLRGFDSDSKRDAGLDTLAGALPSATLNNAIIQQCIALIRAESSLDLTDNSELTSKNQTTSATGFKNLYSFTPSPSAQNIFVPNKLSNISNSNQDHISFNYSAFNTNDHRLVFWANLQWKTDLDPSASPEKVEAPIMETTNGAGLTTEFSLFPFTQAEITTMENKLVHFNTKLELPGNPNDAAEMYSIVGQNNIRNLIVDNTYLGSKNKYLFWIDKRDKEKAVTDAHPPVSPTITNASGTTITNPAYASWNDNYNPNNCVSTTEPEIRNYSCLSIYGKDGPQYLAQATTDYQNDQAFVDRAKDYRTNPAKVRITMTKPTLGFSKPQSPFRELNIELVNPDRFVDQNFNPKKPDFLRLEGMDYSSSRGSSIRSDRHFNDIYHKFALSGANTTIDFRNFKVVNRSMSEDIASNISNTPFTQAGADESVDYESMKESCYSGTNAGGGVNLDAFQPAGWNTSFTEYSNDSWHFASPDPKTTYYDQTFSQNTVVYDVGSIRKVCTITKDASYVSGFFTCQQLIIQDRSTPLEIVGTFMVTRDLTIHPNALKAGIKWSSMHNQDAVNAMKDKLLLKRANGSHCNTLPTPYWHPDPGLETLADRIRCSPVFLLQGKNPPRWTSVDPDCGRTSPTATTTQCLKRIRNFNLLQLERAYGK